MADRARTIALLLMVLAAGALLGAAVSQWRLAQVPASAPPPPRGQAPPGERIRVEVLNAGGARNAAREATELLRERGFDVVYFGNAGRFDRDSSTVIDRIERLGPARLVADALGVRTVLSRPDSNLYVDVSVLLGKDWGLPAPDTAGVKRRPWWDPRELWERVSGGAGEWGSDPS